MIIKQIYNRFYLYINSIRFRNFENTIHATTWKKHDEILAWAESLTRFTEREIELQLLSSNEPIIKKCYQLRNQVLHNFKDKYVDENVKIMLHLPSKESSPGGYSLFKNLAESLKFIGIQTELLLVGEDITKKLNEFQPSVFISSDNKAYTSSIDWKAISEYKKTHNLKVGLTASIQEYGNTPLIQRLEWAKNTGIDFYYSFRAPEYFQNRIEYKPFFEYGFNIISVEFGANPLQYYPLPNISKDIDYIFLASSNPDKQKRYFTWLPSIVKKYIGFIDGPGWHFISHWASQPTHKFLYARSKIGLNLHIDDSIDWASELNERTYILAACGVPQLVDNAKLLPNRFSNESMFVASSPEEYETIFEYMLNHPDECQKRAIIALEEVYTKHTTFHRANDFIRALRNIKDR
jgi:hypothetical protein